MMKTVYLTGAPAAGKSSLTCGLKKLVEPLKIWEYGAKLTELLKQRSVGLKDQTQLREASGNVATPKHIEELDEQLIDWVTKWRKCSHIIIDSHPVTKEGFGFRITAFSNEQISKLCPDEIWVLFIPPELTIERIDEDASGRPMISLEEARIHTSLQASVAASYGISLGCPVYLFDSSVPADHLAKQLAARLS